MAKLAVSLMRPRHLLATALVGLILGGAAVGVVAAGDQARQSTSGPADLEAPFSLPLPNVGDHALYRLNWTHDHNEDGYWPETREFEWLSDTDTLDVNAARVVANRVLLHENGTNTYPDQVVFLEPGTGRALPQPYEWHDNQTTPANGPGTQATSSTSHELTYSFQPQSAMIPCGLRMTLQGHAIDLRAGFDDDKECFNGPGSWAYSGFHASMDWAVGPVGQRLVRFTESPFEGGHWTLKWTVREDIPYPLEIEYGSGAGTSYVLAGFFRGNTTMAMTPHLISPAPGPLHEVARTVTGPSELGYEHPFPLSAAFEQSRLGYPALATFMLQHPDAYVGIATYQEMQDPVTVSRGWVFVVTDGKDSLGVYVSNIYLQAAPPGSPAYYASYADASNWAGDRVFMAPGNAPKTMPSLADMARAWRVVEGKDSGPANYVTFDLGVYCPSKQGCDKTPRYAVDMGTMVDRSNSSVLTPGGERTVYRSQLSVGTGGALRLFRQSQERYTTDFSGGLAAPPARIAPNLSAITPLASIPPGVAGLGAIAGAIAYWAWPALKAGVGRLFSRVKDDEVLEHPVRRDLYHRIEVEPGIHHKALVRAVGKGNGTVEHHVAKLIAAGLVSKVPGSGFTSYFVRGQVDRRAMAAANVLKAPAARKVLAAAVTTPGVPLRRLAADAGVSLPAVHYHLQRLRAAGLVSPDRLEATSDGRVAGAAAVAA